MQAASTLLRDEGPEALTVRRIAAEAGCSTMGVYSRFGGKDGVVDALYREGFLLLRDTIAGVPETDDVLADLYAGCLAYRCLAHEHATHYRIMFEKAVAFEPSDESIQAAADAFGQLLHCVERATAARLLEGDTKVLASSIWATCHGIVSLEIAGKNPKTAAGTFPFEETMQALFRGFQPRS